MASVEKDFASSVALALTSATSSLVPDDKQHESSSPWSLVTSPFESHELNFALPYGWLAADFPCSSAQPGLYPRQDGHAPPAPSDHPSGQDTSRKASGLLDTRKWSPLPSLLTPYVTSGTHFPSTVIGSHAPLPFLDGSFTPDGTLVPSVVPEPRVIPHSQAIPNLSCLSSTGHYDACIGTDPNQPTFPTPTHSTPTSSSFSTELAAFVSNEGQPPLVLYRTPDSSGRRRCQRACAISIKGLWIDKDDLYSVAGQGSSTISVHECQWAKSSKPCGIWIIGSRVRVGAHVRKWHRHTHADSRAQCLWDGCTAKAMLKDSISRHVVTVHLGEGFHCQGCNQEFSRKDVYNQHIEKGEVCRDAGAAMVYGTERRVIDTRNALQGGGPVRYAGR